MRRMVSHLFFCLEWFLWMCFGVDCGLCVGCFPDLWCCAETPPFPALGSTCVFSRFDDPACALSRTSKYQIPNLNLSMRPKTYLSAAYFDEPAKYVITDLLRSWCCHLPTQVITVDFYHTTNRSQAITVDFYHRFSRP